MEVSWQVTGIRHDAYARDHRIAVEEDKGKERGLYLYPAGFNEPKGKAVGPAGMPSNLAITGENVNVTGTSSDAPRLDCERKFVPLPANAARIPIGGGDYAAIVDARFSGTDGACVDGAPTYHTIGSGAHVAAGQRRRHGRSLRPKTAATARSSPSTGRA